MVQMTLEVGERRHVLAQGCDLADLKAWIEDAARRYGRYLELEVVLPDGGGRGYIGFRVAEFLLAGAKGALLLGSGSAVDGPSEAFHEALALPRGAARTKFPPVG